MLMSLPVQPQKYAPVRHLMLYLTEECNLRCTYCFVQKQPRWMTRETALQTLDYVMQRNVSGHLGELTITFFGGEPFLAVDRMQDVIDYASLARPNTYKHFRFAATTNGTLAGPKVERAIREGQVSLLISLDGGEEASKERLTVGGRPSFSKVAQNLARLLSWSPQSTIRMTFTPGGLDLVRRVQQVLELGAPSIALCPVTEAEWTGCEEPLEEAYQELGDWFLSEWTAGRVPPLDITWQLLRTYDRTRFCQSRPTRACPIGDSLLGVDSHGRVMPCHRFLHNPERHLGSVAEAALPLERWEFVHLGRAEIPDCEPCIARNVCGGGCRAVALQAGYGLTGVHPNHCLLLRAHMRQVERIYQRLTEDPRFARCLSLPDQLSGPLAELAGLGS